MFGIGENADFCVFRYQHIGIANAKLWRWGSKQMPGPKANGFASQWNIGLNVKPALAFPFAIYHGNRTLRDQTAAKPTSPLYLRHRFYETCEG